MKKIATIAAAALTALVFGCGDGGRYSFNSSSVPPGTNQNMLPYNISVNVGRAPGVNGATMTNANRAANSNLNTQVNAPANNNMGNSATAPHNANTAGNTTHP